MFCFHSTTYKTPVNTVLKYTLSANCYKCHFVLYFKCDRQDGHNWNVCITIYVTKRIILKTEKKCDRQSDSSQETK